jgi:hypothetical protein
MRQYLSYHLHFSARLLATQTGVCAYDLLSGNYSAGLSPKSPSKSKIVPAPKHAPYPATLPPANSKRKFETMADTSSSVGLKADSHNIVDTDSIMKSGSYDTSSVIDGGLDATKRLIRA